MSITDLNRRLGGPMGRHAAAGGPWRNPAPWAFAVATLLWLLTLQRHSLCRQPSPQESVDAFLRLCYSDVPILFQTSALATGGWPYADVAMEQPPLAAALVALARWVTGLLGPGLAPGIAAADLLRSSEIFFLTTAVLLFICFQVMVACHLLLGRESASSLAETTRGRRRSWDAMLVAASPAVFTAGLVSWDLLAASLTSAALLAWALRRPGLSGVLLGLAIAAGLWPVLVLLALRLLSARAGQLRAWRRAAGRAALVWAVCNVPLALAFPDAWATFYTAWATSGADLGSSWFVLQELGVRIPAVSLLVAALMLSWVAWVTNLVRRAPRRPRVGQVAFLLVAGWLLVGKGYTPQHVVWLVPLVALARPRLGDWAVWSVAEVLYWWAVWAHLGGDSAPGDGGKDVVYLAAIVLRLLVLLWLVQQVARGVREPWLDPVRGPSVDDPAGGVLDHSPDVLVAPTIHGNGEAQNGAAQNGAAQDGAGEDR
ncbi:hypothetical protein [Luteococcus sp. OSA5]|uniref:hypothetical protein n=1 Tax=Luteococcus sp. OSA5 TaxID=3401630 RepID=UPI003B43B794